MRDAQDRHVAVHAVILPRDKVTRHLATRHSELATQIPGTVYLRDEHQKIIVIDGRLTFIGSMNVLAHRPGTRHEIMALFQSATLAQRILEHERADELARPPECPRCGKQVRHVRKRVGADGERRLNWMCQTEGCEWTRPSPTGRERGTSPAAEILWMAELPRRRGTPPVRIIGEANRGPRKRLPAGPSVPRQAGSAGGGEGN